MRSILSSVVSLAVVLGFVVVPGYAQTNYDTSPGSQTGTPAYGAFFSADIDNINVHNRNLNVNIPLFSLPGRELSMGISLTYNSMAWESRTCGGSTCWEHTGGWRVVSPFGGNELSFFSTHSCTYDGTYGDNYVMNVYWFDGNGTKRRYTEKLRVTNATNCVVPVTTAPFDQRTFPSLDGDGSKLYTGQYNSNGTDTAYILFKDGTKRYFRTAYSSSSITYDLITPNGNYLVRDSNGLPTQDTLGRTITFETNYSSSPTSYYERYKITDANGTLRTYQVNFTYPSISNPVYSGNPSSASLSGQSRHISSIDLPNGQSWQFEYNNDQGYLTKVIYPTGAYILYSSNAFGVVGTRIVSSTGSSSDEKTWSYSGCVCDPEGGRVIYGTNSTGTASQIQWQQNIGGQWWTLKTVESSWSQTAVEANGQANQPRIDEATTYLNGNAQSTKTITYDSGNDVTQEKVTAWAFGEPGPVVSQTDITYTTIASSFKRIATKTLTAINPAGGSFTVQGKTEYFYDDYSVANRGTSVPNHTHDTSASNRGNLTRVRSYKDATNYIETQTKYDNVGNVIETIDALTHSTTIDFTDNFTDSTNRNAFAYPKTVTNALSQSATSKYDYNTGLLKEVINIRGYTTTSAYDLMGRVTSVTEPNNKQTTYSYDDTNRITTKEVTVDSSGNKGRLKTYFDKLYRTVQTRTNDPEGEFAVDTEYDGVGRVKKTSNPYRVNGGSAVWTQTTYDALGRPSLITAPDSSTLKYVYMNNVTTTTDQAGNQRRYTYNVLGQMVTVEEPSPTLDTPVVTTYLYYGFGPLHQSNQSSQTRTWVNNWLGQMTSQSLPESGTTSFTYDGAGRLSTKTDARSIVTTLTSDNINRITQRSYSDSTPTVSFTYDQSSQTGLRTAMSDGLGSVTYTYDTVDRLTQESRSLTGVSGTFSTSYVYNVKGDMTQMTYPSGRVVNFAYATSGGCCNSRLASVADGTTSTTLLDSLTYNAAGGVLTQTLNPGSNAINQTFTYNNRLQLTQIQAAKGSTSIMDFTYDYGTSSTNTGRVLKKTDTIQPEHSASYVYDSIYRLSQAVGVDGAWAINWVFDAWGNRTSQTPSGVATSKVGSQTLGYSSNKNSAFTYDSSGNTTNDTVHSYAYNAENQQTSMDGGAATYAYDGEGRRMKKATSIETTYAFYGPGGILCEFSTANTGATTAGSNDKTLYRTSERTGTANLLITTAGVVIENNRTMPYGEAWLSDIASANDNKFTTYDRDKESGLDYAMARMYANSGGRFTSPDQGKISLGVPGTLNRYTYGNADPINVGDPTGNYSVFLTFIAGGVEGCYGLGGVPYMGAFAYLAARADGRASSDDIECAFPEPVTSDCPAFIINFFAAGVGAPCGEFEPEPPAVAFVPQAPAPEPTCLAELRYRPAFTDHILGRLKRNHAFWHVVDRNNRHWIISGAGAQLAALPGDPEVVGPVLYISVAEGTSNPNMPEDDISRAKGVHFVRQGKGPRGICDAVDRMLKAATTFVPVRYGHFTSNSIARYIGEAGGFSPTAPPATTGTGGWQNRIPFPGR